ncbi:MAG: hypothetical protein GY757_25455 [bacterium]|nr:hypothetical protein [bacterium]
MKTKRFQLIVLHYIPVFFLVASCTSFAIACNPGNGADTAKKQRAPSCETRGTWMTASSVDSPKKRDAVLKTIKAAHLNTVLLGTPPIRKNYGHGSSENFMSFIRIAKQQGLQVHAWMENGRRKGRRVELDLRDPLEQDAQVQWVMDLMNRYGRFLDGVHLDYIRFMHAENVNHEGKMDAVSLTVSKISNALKKKYPRKLLTTSCFREGPSKVSRNLNRSNWKRTVPRWFRNWHAANPKSIYHKSGLSVPAHMKYQQNPIYWLKACGVDAVMPMQYSIHNNEWIQTADMFVSFNNHMGNKPSAIVMGLGWMPKPFPTSRKGYDAAGVAQKIKYGRSIGLKGFVIFILGKPKYNDAPLVDILTLDSKENNFSAPFKKRVPACLRR